MTRNVCKLVHISSVLFSLTCIVQGVFLCIYPTKYLDRGWVFTFLLFFIGASIMALYLRFQKCLCRRFQWLRDNIPKWAKWDIKSSLWCVWFVYSIGLMATIAVIFDGVIDGNHKETCRDKNGNFSGTFKNVKMCRTEDNEIFFKKGTICGSVSNETFCWKAKSEVIRVLKNDEFFGPSVLKITLCATPVLMLLLLKSARAPKRDNKRSQNRTDQKEEPEDAAKDEPEDPVEDELIEAELQELVEAELVEAEPEDLVEAEPEDLIVDLVEAEPEDAADAEPEDPVEDEDLKDLYFRATLNLFDGMEMLEELLEHGMHGSDVPQGLERTVLVFVCLFYIFSFLELLHLAFRCKEDKVEEATNVNQNDDEKEKSRKKKWKRTQATNTGFQIVLNGVFFGLRITMWRKYKRDAAIFLAKNLISIVMNVMPYLIAIGCVDDKSDDDDGDNLDGNNGDFGGDNDGVVNADETRHKE